MHIKSSYIITTIILFLSSIFLVHSQEKNIINGEIIDITTREKLPFSSLRLKNYSLGTISDGYGNFQFIYPDSIINDTLIVSHIGYEDYLIDIQSNKKNFKIKLKPKQIEISEAIISPLSAEDYLKRAVIRIKDNYPVNPFQTIAYYSEELSENKNLLHKREGVFKSYYPQPQDTVGNQHQLLLYNEPSDIKKFQFMRAWIEKQDRKQKRKAERKGEELPVDTTDNEFAMDLGGPETVLSFDLSKTLPSFLDTSKFKEFEYSIGEIKSYQSRKLLTIDFNSRGKVDMDDSGVNMRQVGKILLDLESDAIVSIDHSGKIVIPIIARPVLFAIGLKINNPMFHQTVKYEPFKGLWYPKDIYWSANLKLTKRYVTKPREIAELEINQLFFVSEVKNETVLPIPKEKLFDSNEKIENQVYNDIQISWNDINVLKN